MDFNASDGGDVALTMPEELLLLYCAPATSKTAERIREANAVVNPPARLLAAAGLIELVLAGRVGVDSRRGRLLGGDVIVLNEAAPTGDAALDDVMQRLGEARPRSCAFWIKRTAESAEAVYRDRLVAKSVLTPGASTGGDGCPLTDEAALRTVKDRIQAVLDRSVTVAPRDIALVTLLAYTESLWALLDDPSTASAGIIEATKATRRVQRLGREAIDSYGGLGADTGDRVWPDPATPDAIKRIAAASAPTRGS